MPRQKTKELVKYQPSNVSGGTFDHVEIVQSAPSTDAEKLWHLVGRHEALTLNAAFATAAWAANLSRIKESKLYLLQEKDWDTWCRNRSPFSYKTADRMIGEWQEFGKWGFVAREVLQLSREGLRALNPSFTESGDIVIGTDRYSLTNKKDIATAQLAIQALTEDKERAQERARTADSSLEKATTERDTAKAAAKKARQDLLDLKRRETEAFPNATDRQQRLLRAQTQIVMACRLIESVHAEEDLDEVDRGWVEGLCAYGVKLLIEITGHDPFIAAELKSRDLMAEYIAENEGKN